MGTQQVSGLFCAHTETEGKGAGCLFCSPEVPGTRASQRCCAQLSRTPGLAGIIHVDAQRHYRLISSHARKDLFTQ